MKSVRINLSTKRGFLFWMKLLSLIQGNQVTICLVSRPHPMVRYSTFSDLQTVILVRKVVMPKPVVAIVGRPNVGKSTLYNRLIGRRKAIVGDMPGITRDRNYSFTEFDDHPFFLVDTGGFEPRAGNPLMGQIGDQVEKAVEEADCILFVMDCRTGLTPSDREVYRFLRTKGKRVYPVLNKVDGPRQEKNVYEFYELGTEDFHLIAAEQGIGIEKLMEAVVESFPKKEAPEEEKEEAPPKISVVGRPNVGKSTLINSLIGEKRLIASEIPGTTRDAIDTPIRYKGEPYLLVDTAGIRRKGRIRDKIETYSVIKVLKSIERSDLCLILIDALEGITAQDIRVAGLVYEAGIASILLVNKWDRMSGKTSRKAFTEEIQRHLKFMNYMPILFVSALTGYQLNRIFPLATRIRKEVFRRIPTADVNRVLRTAVTHHEPPLYRKRRVRFFYGTQTEIAPPTFILFVNAPAGVHFSYRRFLINQFRKHLGFEQVPIRIFFKKRK